MSKKGLPGTLQSHNFYFDVQRPFGVFFHPTPIAFAWSFIMPAQMSFSKNHCHWKLATHFVRKGCDGRKVAIPQFFDMQRPFRAKGL